MARAAEEHDRGNVDNAVDLLRQILNVDPDLGDAHAMLSLCLLRLHRLHAAEVEAGLALSLDPSSVSSHHAMGAVMLARRKFKEAEEHYRMVLEAEPEEASSHVALSEVYALTGQKDKVLPLLEKALELDPENPTVLVAMGDYYLDKGELDSAERYAREALTHFAQRQDALVLMGYVLLQRGRTDEAREHAIWALRINPAARGPLRLMAAVKARSNPFLGIWWRWSVWMGSMGQSKAIVVLLGAYAAYRILTITLRGAIPDPYVNAIQFAWLGIVVYTWVGPGLFQRMLSKELSKVSLRKDF